MWGLQEKVLRWYLLAAPDAHPVVVSFTLRRWRQRTLECPMPREPLAVAAQLLAASPNGALFRWAFAEAGMPPTWLSWWAINLIARLPDVRSLLLWLEECNALEDRAQIVWMALERDGSLADLRWAAEEQGWPAPSDDHLAYGGDADKARWAHGHLLSVAPERASTPAYMFRRALDAEQAKTAAWAWDELGVSSLVDLSIVTQDPINMDRIDAHKQLKLGALTGRRALVEEAAAHVRSSSTHPYVLVAELAADNGHLDLVEWAWGQVLTHHAVLCPDAATPLEAQLEALTDVVSAVFCKALLCTEPGLLEWLLARVDADPLGPEALRRACAKNTARPYDGFYEVGVWAARQQGMASLADLHERVGLHARDLLWEAVGAGRTDILDWCARHAEPTQWHVMLMGMALRCRQGDAARWLHAHGVPYMADPHCTDTTDLCSCDDCHCNEYAVLGSAVKGGDLALLEWTADVLLAPHGGLAACTEPMRTNAFWQAAAKGYVHVLDWLVDRAEFPLGCHLNDVATAALQGSRLNVLWWLVHIRGRRFGVGKGAEGIYEQSATHSHISLGWLMAHGIWHPKQPKNAVLHFHWDRCIMKPLEPLLKRP